MNWISAGGSRVALVVGNGGYKHASPLSNTTKDAKAMAAAFEGLGFSSTLRLDVEQSEFSRALADFSETAANADVAVVYFAGHGVEVDGESYLLPTGSDLTHVNRVKFETQPLGSIVSAVSGAKTLGLIIVDACRDNPFRAHMRGSENTRSTASRGLAMVEPTGNTLVAYAAKHGTVARDGSTEDHSPFTAALLDYIDRPNLELRLLFGKVRDAVLESTGRTQEPHLYGSLGGKEIFLRPVVSSSAGADVFLSYARKDKDKVALLARLLQREGLEVFWDQDLIVGDDWRDVIKSRLGASRCVVAVWSENSVTSDWVKWEAARGYDKGILIPITIDGKTPSRVFDEIQTEDLSNWDGSSRDPRIARLMTGIKTIIDRTRPPLPTEKLAAELTPARALPPPVQEPRYAEAERSRSGLNNIILGLVAIIALGVAGAAVLHRYPAYESPRPSDPIVAPVTTAAVPVREPVAAPIREERPPPVVVPEPETADAGQLDFKSCAIVLEAVKTCGNLRNCSDSNITENFTSGERQHFASISGTAVFTEDKFYAHCKQVCSARTYKLHPARDILCGY